MSFICYHCNSSYTNKFNLKRHISKKHFNNESEKENDKKRRSRIVCCECNSNFFCFANHHNHLHKDHKVTLSTTKLTFSNISGNYYRIILYITSLRCYT